MLLNRTCIHLESKTKLEHLPSEIPPAASWLPILVIHIKSQVKRRQSQSYKFEKNCQNSNFLMLQPTLQATHLLRLFDKMYKYEMDPTRTVGGTEQTLDMREGRTGWNQYTPRQLCCVCVCVCGGFNNHSFHNHLPNSVVDWHHPPHDHFIDWGKTWLNIGWWMKINYWSNSYMNWSWTRSQDTKKKHLLFNHLNKPERYSKMAPWDQIQLDIHRTCVVT